MEDTTPCRKLITRVQETILIRSSIVSMFLGCLHACLYGVWEWALRVLV